MILKTCNTGCGSCNELSDLNNTRVKHGPACLNIDLRFLSRSVQFFSGYLVYASACKKAISEKEQH